MLNDNIDRRLATIDRIRQLIADSGLSQGAFARRLGLDPGNLSKALSGKSPIGSSLINRISAELSISKQWLINGLGSPADPALQLPSPAQAQHPAGAPVYDIDITAGARPNSRELTPPETLVGRISLPQVSADCPVVKVSGDSMIPVINHGSLISIRPIDPAGIIFWGQIYVVLLDDYRMVKYVRRHSDPLKVTLHSANPAYDDIEIERSSIRALFLVETVINIDRRC